MELDEIIYLLKRYTIFDNGSEMTEQDAAAGGGALTAGGGEARGERCGGILIAPISVEREIVRRATGAGWRCEIDGAEHGALIAEAMRRQPAEANGYARVLQNPHKALYRVGGNARCL